MRLTITEVKPSNFKIKLGNNGIARYTKHPILSLHVLKEIIQKSNMNKDNPTPETQIIFLSILI